jgi:hypothetical protein
MQDDSEDARFIKAYYTLTDACASTNMTKIFCRWGYSFEQMLTCVDGTPIFQILYSFDPDGTGPAVNEAYLRGEPRRNPPQTIAIFDTVDAACSGKGYTLYPADRILSGQYITRCNGKIIRQTLLIDEFNGGQQVIPFGYMIS